MNKKKILSLALVVCVAAILAIGGTLAYFTDYDQATNTFTVGDVDITLTEPAWDDEEHDDVYPGEALPKDPTVTNDGDNPCFVRIGVAGLDCLQPAGMITYETNYVAGALGDKWSLGDDGYFYYTEPLEVGASTSALFQQIRMPIGLTNDADSVENDVVVTAQAVQAQGARASYSAVKAMTVDEIAAWFAESMSAAE